VPRAHVFHRFVERVFRRGVTGGCGNGSYCPDASVTREQMAVFLLRAREGVGYVPPPCVTPTFTDVPCSSPFAPWIEELVRRSVTGGCAPATYCPGAAVTRELREVDGLPRPCLAALPGEGGAPLAVSFPSVPLGRVLRGHLGVVGEAALGGESPVRVEVSLDGREVGRAEAPPGEPGWRTFQLDTELEVGRTRDVAFAIAVRDVPRLVCLDAYTLP